MSSIKNPKPRACKCGCGETFMPSNAQHVYVATHAPVNPRYQYAATQARLRAAIVSHNGKRPCMTCADLCHRRPATGCVECGESFAEDRIER